MDYEVEREGIITIVLGIVLILFCLGGMYFGDDSHKGGYLFALIVVAVLTAGNAACFILWKFD